MGLTIFYSGKIRNMALLPQLTEEVTDLCSNLHWICAPMHPYEEIPLQGFQFHPQGCEPIWMTFRADGKFADPVYYIFKDDKYSPPLPDDEFWLSSVTQFAGMDAHIAVIKLLQYLSKKYFDDFELVDESLYWETNDEVVCKDHFDEFEKAMDEMADKIASIDGQYNMGGDSVKNRIEELIRANRLNEILKALG